MIVMLSVFILITIWKGLTLSLVTIILTLIVLIFPVAISSILNLNEYQVLRRWIQALILAVLVAIFISGIVALTLVLSKIFVNKLTGIVILGFLSGGITGSITRLLIRDGWKYLSSEPIWSWNWAW